MKLDANKLGRLYMPALDFIVNKQYAVPIYILNT